MVGALATSRQFQPLTTVQCVYFSEGSSRRFSNNIVYYKARCELEMKSTMPYQMKLGVGVVGGSGGDVKSLTQVVYAEWSVELVKHHMHHACGALLPLCMPWRNSAG